MKDCLGNEALSFTPVPYSIRARPSAGGDKAEDKENFFKEAILSKTKHGDLVAIAVYEGTEIAKTIIAVREFTKSDRVKLGIVGSNIINREVKKLIGWNFIKKEKK